jgi:hypothetical protein
MLRCCEGYVESAQLLHRLDQRANGLRERIDALRRELESLEEAVERTAIRELESLEEAVERTAIAREVLLALEDQDVRAASAGSDEPGTGDGRSPGDQLPVPVRLSVVPARGQGAAMPAAAPRPIGPVSDQITMILATSTREWRAREIAEALGHASPSRAKTESTRSKLEHLVELGLVCKAGPGLFRIAPALLDGAAHA